MASFRGLARAQHSKLVQRWPLEAVNACWADGWRRAEVICAVETVRLEITDEFDRMVLSERIPPPLDAMNALLLDTASVAAVPLLSVAPRNYRGVYHQSTRASE